MAKKNNMPKGPKSKHTKCQHRIKPIYTASLLQRFYFLIHGYFPKSYGRKAFFQVNNALVNLYTKKEGRFYQTFFQDLTEEERKKLEIYLAISRTVSGKDKNFNDYFEPPKK